MNNSPRIKLLTLCIGAALAQMASLPALADTAVGVDTVIGNAANPGYASSGPVERDADAPPAQRTPTGQMYLYPPATDDVAKGRAVGSVDIGITRDSDQTRNAKRNEYTDTQKNGVIVNNFKLSADSDAARYFTVNGGGVGRNDQFYDVTVGKYNSWKVKAFYNETLHVFTDTWKSLYSGEGTGKLNTGLAFPTMVTSGTPTYGTALTACTAIAPCWNYGGKIYANAAALNGVNGILGTYQTNGTLPTATQTTSSTGQVQSNMAKAIADQLATTPYSELSLVRKKSGMRADVNLSDSVKGYVSYGMEKRVGARPYSMNSNNMSVEIAEPIDYNTHDILTGLSYRDDLTQANLNASASLFRNNISNLVVQYPWLSGVNSGAVMQHATLALAPNNEAYNIKGDFARNLPDLYRGRLTASATYATNRQNDALLAPIAAAENADLTNAGVTTLNTVTSTNAAAGLGLANPGYGSNNALLRNWNTTDALSRKTAQQRIDKKGFDIGLSLNPTDDLNLKGNYHYSGNENKGGYMAYNPLTGQFGRGPIDARGPAIMEVVVGLQPGTTIGAPGSCYVPAGYASNATIAGCAFGTGSASNLTSSATAALPAGAGNAVTSGTNAPVFSPAYSTRQSNYGVTADYALNRTSSLNGAIEREDVYRTFREREKTEENKVKVGYVNRALADTTLRVSFESDAKRGSNYLYNARSYYVMPNGGQIPGLSLATLAANATPIGTAGYYPALVAGNYSMYSYNFRKYDVADRNQRILNTRVNWIAREDLDVGVNLQVKRVAYTEAFYGIKKDNQDSLGFDLNYQPTFDRTVTAFYSIQNSTRSLQENTGVVVANVSCTAANLAIYGAPACSDGTSLTANNGPRPYDSSYTSNTKDRNDVLGLGLVEDLGFARLGVDYIFGRSSTHISYDNIGATAVANTATAQANMLAVAKNALPDMSTIQNTVTLNLVKPLDKKTTVRAMYRFDGMRVTDWHYNNVIHNAVSAIDGNTLLLDSGYLNYHVNTFGVFLNYKL